MHAQDLQHAGRIRAYDYVSHVADSFNSPSDKWFVATDGNEILGSVRSELETERNPLYRHEKALYIDDIAIATEYRRKGVGGVLVAACVDYANDNGIQVLQAMIYDWNCPSIGLFERAGFVRKRGDFFRVNQ